MYRIKFPSCIHIHHPNEMYSSRKIEWIEHKRVGDTIIPFELYGRDQFVILINITKKKKHFWGCQGDRGEKSLILMVGWLEFGCLFRGY